MRVISVYVVLSLVYIAVIADIYDDVKNAKNFTGKVVLITGSSSGFGEVTAKLFSSLGASVVITGRNQTNVKRVAQQALQLSPHALKPLEVVADLTIDDDVIHLVNETITAFGRLDVLVNNAGAAAISFISDDSILNEFDSTFRIDLRAQLYLSHLTVSHLQKSKGTIINISSGLGITPFVGSLTYSMAKAALDMMTKVLAVELGNSGVRVNTINPGYFETNLANRTNTGIPEQVLNVIKQKQLDLVPLKIKGDPIEVAKAVIFLASSDAQYITGANIVVDGGSIYNTPANFITTIFNTTSLY